jgi:hypothetical protein
VLTAGQGLEYLTLLASQRIERTHRLAVGSALTFGDFVQVTDGGRWVIHDRQRIAIATVSGITIIES